VENRQVLNGPVFHGLPKVLLGPDMPYHSIPCGRPPLKPLYGLMAVLLAPLIPHKIICGPGFEVGWRSLSITNKFRETFFISKLLSRITWFCLSLSSGCCLLSLLPFESVAFWVCPQAVPVRRMLPFRFTSDWSLWGKFSKKTCKQRIKKQVRESYINSVEAVLHGGFSGSRRYHSAGGQPPAGLMVALRLATHKVDILFHFQRPLDPAWKQALN
jgi:hypothetical protein